MDFKRADEVYEEAIGVYRCNYTETFEKPGDFHHPQNIKAMVRTVKGK
jgi:hypothetical protein